MTGPCVIPDCVEIGKHRIGLRCRIMSEPSPVPGKGKTDALWSVESDAYLCDTHALDGVDITLLIEASQSGAASVRVLGAGTKAPPRRVQIKKVAIKTG
jgi:hypothetical protein